MPQVHESSPSASPPASILRRQRLAHFALALAAGILAFYFATLLSAAALFALRLHLNHLPAAIGVACGIGAIVLFFRLTQPRRWLRDAALAIAILAVYSAGCAVLAGCFYDMTYDGQAYHQETIIQLAGGWNPLRGDLDAQAIPSNETRPHVNGLARGAEIVEASIYLWTHSIEPSKMLNLLVLLASLLAVLVVLLHFQQISTARAVLLAAAMALNPVCIYQTFSFYVDGQLASLLLCLLAFLVSFAHTGQRRFAALAVITTAALLNVKSTAAVFAGIYLAAAVLWLLWRRQGRQAGDLALAGVAGLVLGAFIGLGPYLTNIIRHGHPLYPFAGPHDFHYDWTKARPADFNAIGRLHRLFRSIASMPADEYTGDGFAPSRLGVPLFFWPPRRLEWFAYPDVRAGGFGPFFSGALLLAIGAFIAARPPKAARWATLAIAATLLASVLVHPESWWARFCPQLYVLCPLLLVPAAISPRRGPALVARLALGILLLNIATVSAAYVGCQTSWNIDLHRQLRQLRGRERPLIVDFGSFRSNRVRLQEAGIRFVEADFTQQVPRDAGKPSLFVGSRVVFY